MRTLLLCDPAVSQYGGYYERFGVLRSDSATIYRHRYGQKFENIQIRANRL